MVSKGIQWYPKVFGTRSVNECYVHLMAVLRVADLDMQLTTVKWFLTLSWAATHYYSAVAIKNLTIIMLSTTYYSEEIHRNNCLEMMLI